MTEAHEKTGDGIAPVVERNIQALLAAREAELRELSWQEKLAVSVANFAGSFFFVVLHVIVYGAWVLSNSRWIPGLPLFDPKFSGLAAVASVEAIFLSAFILITQNRMMAQADRRADLNLQISLLAEHEVTRLLTLTQAVAQKLNVPEAGLPGLEHLQRDVTPEQVLETIDREEKKLHPE